MAGKKLDQDSLLGIKTYIDEGNARDEKLANKVTTLSSSSTDTQYPSAKAVFDNLQNIREVAEGKCETYILSYKSNIAGTKSWFSNLVPGTPYKFQVYNVTTGELEDKTAELLNGDYDNITIINNQFNTQNDVVAGTNGYLLLDPITTSTDEFGVAFKLYPLLASQSKSPFKLGDIFLVTQTDVPDRWYDGYLTPWAFHKLETSKIDLTQYYTKDQIAALFSSYITSPYDNTSTYAVGKYVTYNGALYRCIIAVSTAEDFDATKWTAVKVGSELERMVTTDTEQTITEEKTFTNGIKIGSATEWNIIKDSSSRLEILNGANHRYLITWNGVQPYYTNSNDLGTSNILWKDLYLAGNLSDGTNSVSIANIVTTDTNQTITGEKTFVSGIKLYDDNASAITSTQYSMTIKVNNTNSFYIYNNSITPTANNSRDLGTNVLKWRDLYLNRNLSDGTNSVTIADISNGLFNVINASDIVNNTLTQAQYDLITNGKPTLIKGTILGITNLLLVKQSHSTGGGGLDRILGIYPENYGVIKESLFNINSSFVISKYLDLLEFNANKMNISNIGYVNGKLIPAYPSNTGTFGFKSINGTLSWENEIPTSISLTDRTVISDVTVHGLITRHQPIVLNGYTCYFSCDDGNNYQYVSTRYDANANKNHINVITINKSTWVAIFHTSDIALS